MFCATVIIFVVEVANAVAVTAVAAVVAADVAAVVAAIAAAVAAVFAVVAAVAVIVEVHQEMSQKWGLNVNSVSVEKKVITAKEKMANKFIGCPGSINCSVTTRDDNKL